MAGAPGVLVVADDLASVELEELKSAVAEIDERVFAGLVEGDAGTALGGGHPIRTCTRTRRPRPRGRSTGRPPAVARTGRRGDAHGAITPRRDEGAVGARGGFDAEAHGKALVVGERGVR